MTRIKSTIVLPAALVLLSATTGLAAPKTSTVTTLSFVPSASVNQFSSASAVVTVTANGSPVTTGTVQLSQVKLSGLPGTCSAHNGKAAVQPNLEGTLDSNGQATFDLNTAGLTATLGTIGYVADYSGTSAYSNSVSGCLDFTVTLGIGDPGLCPAGQNATIAATFVTSPGYPLPGSTNTWNLKITVHACKALTNVSAQGGGNAWTGASYLPPSPTTISLRNTGGKNQIVVWSIGSMAAGTDRVLDATVIGSIKPNTACGTILGLLGSWSALSTSVDFGSQKSEYSGTSTVTVGPYPCF